MPQDPLARLLAASLLSPPWAGELLNTVASMKLAERVPAADLAEALSSIRPVSK